MTLANRHVRVVCTLTLLRSIFHGTQCPRRHTRQISPWECFIALCPRAFCRGRLTFCDFRSSSASKQEPGRPIVATEVAESDSRLEADVAEREAAERVAREFRSFFNCIPRVSEPKQHSTAVLYLESPRVQSSDGRSGEMLSFK